MEDASKYKFLNRNIKLKTYGSIFTNPSNISVEGNSFEFALEMIKQTDNMTTLPELFFRNTNFDTSGIETRNIDNLIGPSNFYAIVRNDIALARPVLWLVDELKNLVLPNK